jgi:hypothetical protein
MKRDSTWSRSVSAGLPHAVVTGVAAAGIGSAVAGLELLLHGGALLSRSTAMFAMIALGLGLQLGRTYNHHADVVPRSEADAPGRRS